MSPTDGWPQFTREEYASRDRAALAWSDTDASRTGTVSPRPTTPADRRRQRRHLRHAPKHARASERDELRGRLRQLQQSLADARRQRDAAAMELSAAEAAFAAERRREHQDRAALEESSRRRLVDSLTVPLLGLEEVTTTASPSSGLTPGLQAILAQFRSALGREPLAGAERA